MKHTILSLLALVVAVTASAVTPVPYTEVVSSNLRVQGNGSVSLTIYDETGSQYNATSVSGGGTSESGVTASVFRPGKKYTLSFSGSGAGYTTWLSFIAPEGYQVYADHVATNMLPLGYRSGSYSRTLTFELRPAIQNSSPAPIGAFSGIQLGKSVSWEVGLGALHGGRNAGRLYFKEYDLSSSPSTRAKLYLAMAQSTGEVWTINDGPSNQTLRQVITPLVVIDLLDDGSGGYWIRFFPHSQSEGSPGNPNILYGSPWKTIRVQSPASNQLKITETEGSAIRVSHLTLSSGSVPSGNYFWTLQEGDGSTWLRTTTHDSSTSSAVGSGGSITTVGNDMIHTFTSNGTFTLSQPVQVTYLLVGGGGGGGGGASVNGGGGGGGGGFLQGSASFAATSHGVTVGQGGAAGTAGAGGDGGSSSVNGITALGGGGGGGYGQGGRPGGSGGGAGRDTSASGGAGSQGGSGGNAGGSSWGSAGGGGGAGQPGQAGGNDSTAWTPYKGNGGNAALSTIRGYNVWFAGGGGGAWQTSGGGVPQPGSYGGAGSNSGGAGTNGVNGYGGGGGGGQFANGGSGGSGVVVLRYANPRQEIVTVRTGGTSGTVVAKTKFRYDNVGGWGEELVQVTADPDSAALVTTYSYHTNSANLGNYRRVRSVTGPTGGWSAQEYYDDWDRRGQLKYQYAPHLDSPSSVTLDPAQGRSTYYEYTADWSGRYSRPTLLQEKTGNVVTAKTTWSHGDYNPYDWTREYSYQYSYRDASNYETTYIERYRADAWPTLAGRQTSIKGANQSQTSWSVVNGYYTPSTGVFNQVGQSIAHIREIWVHGSTNSSGANAVSSWDGHNFTSVYLVPNKSTMDVVIYASPGTLLRKEKWVYTGSGFSLLNWENYTYNDQIRVTSQVASNGATVTNTYTNGLLSSTVGAGGTETQFTYDLLWRTATTVKKGASSTAAVLTGGYNYPAQGDITTTNTYDGSSRVTQQVVSGGALSLTSSAAFDLAGRPTSQTAPGGYVTSFGYSAGGKIVTATLPGGATKVTETHLDGRTKSITGTSAVNEFYTYNTHTNGMREFIRRQASSGGPIMDYTYSDWLNRNYLRQVPSPTGSGYIDHAWYYNSSGQLWKETRTGSADTLYQYDTLGRLSRSGLDVNTNGSLDLASSDRITDNGWTIAPVSGNWWLQETTSTYASTGSGTASQVAKREVQLSGFPANRLARTDTTDIFGNITASYTEVDRAAKKLVATTDTPDSATNVVRVAYNGLAVEARSAAGVTMRSEHDALGRAYKSIDPRTGATVTAFVSGTSLVSTVTDPASAVQATYTYDSAGRVSSVKDALNKYTYTSYTSRNEVHRQWGDATYPVEYGYDSQGRRTTMSTYRGGSSWTGSSWPGSPGTADTTTWAYHAPTGLLLSKTDAASKAVTYSYTQAGQPYTRTWARGVVTTYGYSSTTAELTSVNYSDATPDVSVAYNRLGQMVGADLSDGLVTSLDPCICGKLVAEVPDATFYGNRRIDYILHPTADGTKGRTMGYTLTQGSTTEQSIGYGYDSQGRFNALTVDGAAFSYGYVSNSQLVGTVAFGVFSDTRTYDPYHSWVDSRAAAISSTTKAAFAYAQDNLGRVTQVNRTGEMFNRYGNGSQGLATVYGYDDRSQLTSEITYLGGTGTVLTGRDDAYAYDNIGNRSSTSGTTHNSNTANYTTNALNQYTQRSVPDVFDVAGAASSGATVTVNSSSSGVSRHGEYFFKGHGMANNPNPAYSSLAVSDGTSTVNLPAFTAGTPESFGYDFDGNLTGDGRWTRTYDAENRLIAVETTSAAYGSGAPRQRLEFRYDAFSRRIGKKVYSYSGGWVLDYERRFLYDQWNLIAELAVSGSTITPLRTYAWGLDLSGSRQGAGGVGGLLMIKEAGNSYLPAYDALGNVHAMIKSSDGSIAAAYEYDAFGKQLRESGPYAASNPFRFSTKYTDSETGDVYYGYRFYAPTLGRFVNRDPIAERGGLNLYAFVGNAGVNSWDYLGMVRQQCRTSSYMVCIGFYCEVKADIICDTFPDNDPRDTGGPRGPTGGGGGGGGNTQPPPIDPPSPPPPVVDPPKTEEPAPNKPDCAGMAAEMSRLDKIVESTSTRLNQNIVATGDLNSIQRINETLSSVGNGTIPLAVGQLLLVESNRAWINGARPVAGSGFLGIGAARGPLYSPNALRVIGGAGAGLSVLGAAIDTNTAIDAFVDGRTGEGISYGASAIGGTVGVFVPPIGAATVVGSALRWGIEKGGEWKVNQMDQQGRIEQNQRDVGTFQSAFSQWQSVKAKFDAAGCK